MNFNRDPAYVDLLNKLKSRRKELGWTQVKLGERLKRPQAYIAKVETGSQRVDLIEFHRWATALKLEPLTLVQELFDALEAFPRGHASIAGHKDALRKRVRVNKS